MYCRPVVLLKGNVTWRRLCRVPRRNRARAANGRARMYPTSTPAASTKAVMTGNGTSTCKSRFRPRKCCATPGRVPWSVCRPKSGTPARPTASKPSLRAKRYLVPWTTAQPTAIQAVFQRVHRRWANPRKARVSTCNSAQPGNAGRKGRQGSTGTPHRMNR